MADRTGYYLTIGIAGFIGAGLTAVGNAFGFSRRLKSNEIATKENEESLKDVIKCLHKTKEDYYSREEQDANRDATKELMRVQLTQHTEAIEKLEKTLDSGLKEIFSRLNNRSVER